MQSKIPGFESEKEPSFEEAFRRLEEIVEQLEKGELSLDDSIRLFEEGIKLARLCTRRLEEAERQIEVLLQDENGKLSVKPMEETR